MIKIFYIIAGIVLISFNLKFDYDMARDYNGGVRYSFSIYMNVWCFLAFNLFLFIGIILLIVAFGVQPKKLNRI